MHLEILRDVIMIGRTPMWLAGLAVFAGLAGNAGAAGLGTGIQDAAALNRFYSFAEECVGAGELPQSELELFQVQVLDALEEKYSLAADERQVLKAYLVGSASFTAGPMDQQILPASGMTCDMATEITG